jgi:hypothetical protein
LTSCQLDASNNETQQAEKEEITAEQPEPPAQPDAANREILRAEQFKPQAMKFLKALREDSVTDFSELVTDNSFYISRLFTFGNYDDARGENVLLQKIDLKNISSLNFPIGAKNQLSELNLSFYSVFESDSANEAPFEEIPTKIKSTDVF